MPTIKLKPNSPEFADTGSQSAFRRRCEMPGCAEKGDHRAPKDRGLNDYHWFCVNHVQDYNRAWNYFTGMSPQDVEDHVINSFYWDRPTWRQDSYRGKPDDVKRAAFNFYHFSEDAPPNDDAAYAALPRAERDALAAIGFDTAAPFDAIKARYKELAKKYHPDLNPGNSEAEDLLKKINMAYTYLKVANNKH